MQINSQSAANSSAQKPSFEVASIRPNASGAQLSWIWFGDPGRVTEQNVTIKMLIEFAFDIKDDQLSGAPSWVNSEKYDVVAKIEDSAAKASGRMSPDQQTHQLRLMFQSLLAERFKLGMTHGTKELPVFKLVIGRNGPRLSEVTFLPSSRSKVVPGRLTMQGSTAALADLLRMQLNTPVIDETNLRGVYDIDLTWIPDRSTASPNTFTEALEALPEPDAIGPSIFTAIQQQLGLKLESTRGPVDIVTIDHIERPSEN